jgi:hypothetical protein
MMTVFILLILNVEGCQCLLEFFLEKKTMKEMTVFHTSENCKQCMRLQKAVSSMAWLAHANQDAQCTKNLSKKYSMDACVYFAKKYSFLALTEHTGEIFFSSFETPQCAHKP